MSVGTHLRVLIAAWRAENQRRRTATRRLAHDFLPAALEIAETPPSPFGRAILWLIIAAAVSALAWACLSEVDTVAVAEGRVTPRGRLRTVDAADTGFVREIRVREGDHVQPGQILVALDPTVADADAQTARTELAAAALLRARSAALLASVAGVPRRLTPPPSADPAAVAAEQMVVDARARELAARLGGLDERRAGALAAVRVADANVEKIQQTLPFARQQVQAYETLALQGYGAKLRLAQEQERFLGLTHELRAEVGRREEASAQVAALGRERSLAIEEYRSQAAREAADAEAVVATRGDQLRKSEQRAALQALRAPVAGVVQELSVTTIGQVVEAGKAVVTLVPDGEELVAEVLILNKDIGAVRTGDRVVVKLEAYPFTRYGALSGRVHRISPDSIRDEARGLVFPATVRLDPKPGRQSTSLRLGPGMVVSAEVATGRRRVIEYLLSPVLRATREAGRER